MTGPPMRGGSQRPRTSAVGGNVPTTESTPRHRHGAVGRRDVMGPRRVLGTVPVVRVVTALAGGVCLAMGGVSGVAFVLGTGVMTAPAKVVVAVTTAGFLVSGVVLVARARSRRPE